MSRPMSIEKMVSIFKSKHTTSYLFMINDFSLLRKYEIERVESSVFGLGGHKWKLFVYPSGNANGKGHVSIFLENQFQIDVMLEYEVFVVSQLEPTWHSAGKYPFGKSLIKKRRGNQTLIPLGDLEKKGYLIGDCCMFGVKLFGIEPAKSAKAECFSLIEKPNNHKVTWVMKRFSSLDLEESHCSNEFVVGTRKWQIEVYPEGDLEERDKSLSVYLCGLGFINNVPKAKTFAKFQLRVLDQVNQDHVEIEDSHWFDEEEDALGFSDFMPLEELDEPYLMKDKLYVGVEFEVISVTHYY